MAAPPTPPLNPHARRSERARAPSVGYVPAVPPLPPDDDPSQGGWSDPGVPTVPEDGSDGAVEEAPKGPRYRIGALLGRGGMGAVYAARDATLGRDVALKELQPELAQDAGARARLAREAAVTSRLDHPGIVSVHDGGLLPDGRPFYTMRLVRGRTLGRAAAEAKGPEGRRTLVRHVLAAADAVAAAHDAGVVHRDLKPANILIGAHGETQVVDWGLATPTAAAAGRWVDLPASAARGVVGTRPYMAPEQERGDPPDPRHDVWSLGITLAHVVGGERGELPPELAAIVARATAPALGDRYANAAAFADDLLRWFEGRRVAAYTYTSGDLLRRTLAAYRLPLGIAAAGLLALAAAVAGGWWQTTRSLDRALAAEAVAVGAEADARAALADLRLEQAVVATRAGARETAERLAIAVLREREDPLARGVLAAFGRAERPARVGTEAGPTCAWSALPTTTAGEAPWVLCGTASAVARWEGGAERWTAPVVADGAEVRGDRVRVWAPGNETLLLDAATGAILDRRPLGRSGDWVPQAPPRAVWVGDRVFPDATTPPSGCRGRIQAIDADEGGRVVTICGDGTLLIGTVTDPTRVRVATEAKGDHVATAVLWAPDGRIVVGTLRGRVYVYDGDTGALLSSGPTELGAIDTVRVSADSRYLALGGAVGGVGVWRLDTAALVGEVPAERPRAFGFGPEGLRVHDEAGAIHTWALPGGAPAVFRARAGLADIAASPDGARMVVSGGDGTIVAVGLADGHALRRSLGEGVVKSIAFDAGGDRLLATGMTPPYLGFTDGDTWTIPTQPRPLRRVAWLGDGTLFGVDLNAGYFRWAPDGAPPTRSSTDRLFIDLERDGDTLVLLDARGQIDRLDGDTLTPLLLDPAARAVAIRGPRLAVATADAVILQEPAGVRRLEEPGASLLDVALSFDGSRVAASGLDGLVRVWDVGTGRLLGRLPGHTERVVAVEFLPGGDLVSASWDKSARVWALDALVRPVDALAAEIEAAWGQADGG